MIEAHEAAERAKRCPSVGRVVVRALGGLGGGAASGALGGGLFALAYQPHGGGPGGDWTAIVAWVGMGLGGALLGLAGGVVCGLTGFRLWKLLVALVGLGLLGGVLLIAAN